VHQVWGFAACFSSRCSDGSFYVSSPSPLVTSTHSASISLKTSHFQWYGDLEFITDHFDNLTLSPDGDDSSTVVRGMACSGSLSLHTIPKESTSEHDSASSEGESSGFPVPRVCNVMTSTIPSRLRYHWRKPRHFRPYQRCHSGPPYLNRTSGSSPSNR
jgi:hypothetical protein